MFFKKKNNEEIAKVCSNIYDISLHITEKINNILANYGYSLNVQKHKLLFVSITSMYCYYFFEVVLKKYYNYDDEKCFMIIYLLLKELNTHIENVTFDQTFGVYMDIKNILNSPPNDNLEEFVSIHYLIMAIELEQDEVETKLLLDIYGEFNSIIKNIYKIL